MIVTLLTDFGTRDYFVAAMKGVILRHGPGISVVDITHEVPRHDVGAAAFLLGACYRDFPPGTVHVVVVDPGVGSSRAGIVVASEGFLFVGPDNGVLSEPLRRAGQVKVLEPESFVAGPIGMTFHGRDVFAPAAAALAMGEPLDRLGSDATRPPILLETLAPSVVPSGLIGRIQFVDHFGNCVTTLRPQDFRDGNWRRYRFSVGDVWIPNVREFYADAPEAEPFMILGSAGYLEISVNLGSAAEQLGFDRGMEITATPHVP